MIICNVVLVLCFDEVLMKVDAVEMVSFVPNFNMFLRRLLFAIANISHFEESPHG